MDSIIARLAGITHWGGRISRVPADISEAHYLAQHHFNAGTHETEARLTSKKPLAISGAHYLFQHHYNVGIAQRGAGSPGTHCPSRLKATPIIFPTFWRINNTDVWKPCRLQLFADSLNLSQMWFWDILHCSIIGCRLTNKTIKLLLHRKNTQHVL